MRSFILSIVVLCFCSGWISVHAQKPAPAEPVTDSSQENGDEAADEKESTRRFRLFGSLSLFYDSNADHSQTRIRSFGTVARLGFHFQNRLKDPSFQFEYEGALHRFTNSDRFERFSNRLALWYRKRFLKRWAVRTDASILLKGSPEDRELNDWYTLGEMLEYRLTSTTRLEAFAAYRIKRNPNSEAADAIDSYVGGGVLQRFGKRSLHVTYRYDNNRAKDVANRFIRWRFDGQFQTPLRSPRNHLLVDVSYVPVLFAKTTKSKVGPLVLHDWRWVAEIDLRRRLNRNLEVTAFYRYENRDSNNPNRKYNAHMTGVTFGFWW